MGQAQKSLVTRLLLKKEGGLLVTSQGNPQSSVRRDDWRSCGCSTTPIQIHAIAGTTSFICVATAWEATIRI